MAGDRWGLRPPPAAAPSAHAAPTPASRHRRTPPWALGLNAARVRRLVRAQRGRLDTTPVGGRTRKGKGPSCVVAPPARRRALRPRSQEHHDAEDEGRARTGAGEEGPAKEEGAPESEAGNTAMLKIRVQSNGDTSKFDERTITFMVSGLASGNAKRLKV